LEVDLEKQDGPLIPSGEEKKNVRDEIYLSEKEQGELALTILRDNMMQEGITFPGYRGLVEKATRLDVKPEVLSAFAVELAICYHRTVVQKSKEKEMKKNQRRGRKK